MHIRPTYGGNNANATETVNGTPAPVVNEIPALVAKPHNDHEDTQSSSPTTNGTMIHKNWPTANIPQRLLRVNKVILFRIATCSKEKRMLMKLATFSPIVASVHCLPELCYVTVCCVAVICSVQLRQGVILHRSWWSTCAAAQSASRDLGCNMAASNQLFWQSLHISVTYNSYRHNMSHPFCSAYRIMSE